MDDPTDTEFAYTYVPADGSLADLKKRFRLSDHGPQIRAADGSTITGDLQPGSQLIIPKPTEIPWYDKADWQPVLANKGELLPALISRAQSDGAWKGRVMHADAPKTQEYVWHDWRNWEMRRDILVPSGGTIADSPKKDLDPKSVQFQGVEYVDLPLKPVKHIDLPVVPGNPGDAKGPAGTVDVSHSEFEELQGLLDEIASILKWLEHTREQALAIQAQCETWLVALTDLREIAVNTDAAYTLVHTNDSNLGKRQAFITALNALIDKAGPLILDPGSCVPKVSPDLIKSPKDKITNELIPLLKKPRTKELLAKIIPSQGDVRFERGGDGIFDTIERVSILAATAAHWLAEVAPRDTALGLLETAMTAMASGAAPSASATSIIDFAVAIPFYVPDGGDPWDFKNLLYSVAPEGCCAVVAGVFWALKTSEAAAQQDPSVANAATDTVGAGLDKIAGRSGWTTFRDDFAHLAKEGFKSWSEFKEQYKPLDEAKATKETGEAIAKAADPALEKAKDVVDMSQHSRPASAHLGIQAANKYGAERMKRAYAVVEEMQHPSERFPAQWRKPGGKIPALWGLGQLAFKVGSGAKGLGSDWDNSVQGALKTEKSALETVKDSAEALQKLKIIETEELTLMLGRVTLVLGVAIELCEIRESVEQKDVVGGLSHGALAAACICFLIGGVCCTVGTGLLVVGTAVLIVRSGGGLTSGTADKLGQIFPDERAKENGSAGDAKEKKSDGGTFESLCSKPLGLDAEITRIKQTFDAAVAERRGAVRPPDPW